jgi:hypothetical protein
LTDSESLSMSDMLSYCSAGRCVMIHLRVSIWPGGQGRQPRVSTVFPDKCVTNHLSNPRMQYFVYAAWFFFHLRNTDHIVSVRSSLGRRLRFVACVRHTREEPKSLTYQSHSLGTVISCLAGSICDNTYPHIQLNEWFGS